MVPPDTTDFVEHWLGRMAIEPDKPQREIRGHKGIGQCRKGKGRKQELHRRRRFRHSHPTGPAFVRPHQRHNGLHDRDEEREDEGEMTEFCNHVAEYRRHIGHGQCVSSLWSVHIVAGFCRWNSRA